MIKSFKYLCYIVKFSKNDLLEIADSTEQYFHPFVQKGRNLNSVDNPLLTIQKRINLFLQNNVEFPKEMYGGLKGKNNILNSKKHLGKKYKFKTDFKNYFPSINHKKVYNALIAIGFSADIASIVTKLTTFKGMLPQGAPTSTILANIVILPTFLRLKKWCDDNEIVITNFVDDIAFSSHKCFKSKTQEIINILLSSGLKINYNKTLYKIGNIEITGVNVKNNVLTPSDKIKGKIETEKNSDTKQNLLKYAERIKKA